MSGAELHLVDLEDKTFDPFEMEKLFNGTADDPFPRIQKMRAQAGVHHLSYRMLFTDVPDNLEDRDHYTVLGYDNVARVLNDPATFTNYGAFKDTGGKVFGKTVVVMDPPDHPKYRKVLQKAFLPQTVSKWGESVIEPVLDELLDKFARRGTADLVAEFTHHYPFKVIYRQLALSPRDAPIFHKLAIAQLLLAVGAPQGMEATAKLGHFFQALIEQRRADPGTDLISHMATVEADGERLPDEVVISFLRQLINAAADTTYRGTSNLLTGLLTHPDQYAALVADRSLALPAIEEALRWEPPVLFTWRHASKTVTVDGVEIPEGSLVDVVIGSANRDPAKYKNPDAFDILRDRSVRNLAFAAGPHVCIGQHLARVEMTRALNALIDRLPNLRLSSKQPPPDIRGHNLRVPDHIYVEFDAR